MPQILLDGCPPKVGRHRHTIDPSVGDRFGQIWIPVIGFPHNQKGGHWRRESTEAELEQMVRSLTLQLGQESLRENN